MSEEITWELRKVEALSVTETKCMFQLMHQCYDNVALETFMSDLAEKHWALMIRAVDSGDIVGFSTQKLREIEIASRPISILFSGDTVIKREYWGKRDLLLASACLVDELMKRVQGEKFFWFLISKGYKTYHFLPVLFKSYFPRLGAEPSAESKAVIDYLGRELGGDLYDAQKGVIHSTGGWYVLKEDIAEMTTLRPKDPHAQFFLQRNPGFAQGDELCCLAELSADNYTNVALRLLKNYKRQKVELMSERVT